jgi:hypothetical protein
VINPPKQNKCFVQNLKYFKIRRIIEYPDTQEEGGWRARIGFKAGNLGLFLDFVKE